MKIDLERMPPDALYAKIIAKIEDKILKYERDIENGEADSYGRTASAATAMRQLLKEIKALGGA